MGDWNEAIEAAAKAIEEEKFDTSIRIDPRKHPNISDWMREQRASFIRSLKRPAEQDGGWVLVPKEPTEEMRSAAFGSFSNMGHALLPDDIWQAMLAAAPSPEKAEGER